MRQSTKRRHVTRCTSGALCGVLAIGLALPAAADWPADPATNLAIADGAGEQVLPKIVSTPDGGCYVSWFENSTGNYNVRIQALDPRGRELWPHNGILVSNHPSLSFLVDYDLAADAGGNAVVVFTDARDGSDRDIFAYRVTIDGQLDWGPNGVTLSSNGNFEADPRVAQTSTGDYVFVWPRGDTPNPGLVMQRLDSAGNKQLGPDGIVVAGDGVENPSFCEMVAADNGSVIVTWIRDTRTFLSPRHVRAQKFSPGGTPMWGASPIIVSDAISVPITHRPRIVYDGAGGAVIAWHDTRASNLFNCWVQHISSDGTLRMPANGAQASTLTSQQHIDPAIAFRPTTGETFVFWNERNLNQSQWGVYGQKLSPDGARLWGDSGITYLPLNSVNKLFVRAVPYSDGAIVLFLDEPNTPLPGDRVLGFRVDAAGGLVWSGSPRVVSSNQSTKGRLPVTIGSDGVVKAVWEDGRNSPTDVYGQNLNPNGTLGFRQLGDLDGDGHVSEPDLGLLLQAWQSTARGDLDGDGDTDESDLSILLQNWGA